MTTTTVSPEVETPKHFSDCDSLAIGRRVKRLALLGTDVAETVNVLALAQPIDHYRGECSCFALQLTRVEADLAARRKAQRAGFDREAEIEQLLLARDVLRQAVAR